MSTISWVENVPSGTSSVGAEPSHLQQLWTALATGLATSLSWDGSGGASATSRGELQYGASRTFFAPQSASSSATTSATLARAFLASNVSRLFVYDSAGTYLAGTPFLLEHATNPGANIWVRQSGSTLVVSNGTPTSRAISFTSAYATVPVSLSLTVSEKSFVYGVTNNLAATGFTSFFSFTGPGTQPSFTLSWLAVGQLAGPQ